MPTINFALDSNELSGIAQILQKALLERPTPKGLPYLDLDEAIDSTHEFFESLQDLAYSSTELTTQDLRHLAQGMAKGYTTLWHRPFPYGLEEGQMMLSQVLEKPIRNLLRALSDISHGNSDYLGNFSTSLEVSNELTYFDQWARSAEPHYRSIKPAKPSCELGFLAASFLLGWWIGRS